MRHARALRPPATPRRALHPALLAVLAGSAVAAPLRPLAAWQRADIPELPGPPAYFPLNPHVASRSAIGTEPFRVPRARGTTPWRFGASLDYGSAAERDANEYGLYLLDAELLRAELSAERAVGSSGFVAARGGVAGAYGGFADAFFDGYHRLIHYRQRARAARPRNEFAYLVDLPGRVLEHEPAGTRVGDLRLTAGGRLAPALQGSVSLTLPTSTAPAGYARGAASVAATGTARFAGAGRTAAELGASAGYTPTRGAFRDLQRERFYALSGGMRLRLRGASAAYGTLFYHSQTHRGTGLPEHDGRELTADFGWLLVTRGGRVWRLGLAEDFGPRDTAIDLALRAGVAW